MKVDIRKPLLILLSILIGLTWTVMATSAAEMKFAAKTINFVVPTSPGGGFDTNARLIAPFLKKYLPDQPNVIIKNVPGAAWRLGIMEMYKSKPDGGTVCIFNIPGNVVDQVSGLAQYDLTKIAWVGNITGTFMVTALSPKTKVRTLDDLRKASNLKTGVVGLSSTASLATLIAAEEMGFKVRPINYDGSTEALLSAIRGDTDLVTFNFPSIKKFIIDSKELIPFVVYSKNRIKEMPDTPTAVEMGYEKLLDVVGLDNMIGAPPGTPPEILKVWQTAFNRAIADPEFQKMIKNQLKHDPTPLNGDQTAQKVNGYFQTYGKYKDLIMQYTTK
jgi:tripartite-type tricarboxylate transporter receptor subunit TctC